MKYLDTLYEKMEAEKCNACKLALLQKIAFYKDKKVTILNGALNRGFNIHFHRNGVQPAEYNLRFWLPNLNHNHLPN